MLRAPAAAPNLSAAFSASSALPLPAGLRSTQATRALLAFFQSYPQAALSGAEVEATLGLAGVVVNRVTVYRLLERLTGAGLLRRHVDAQRVARFSLAAAPDEEAAPRFECDDCHRQFRLSKSSGRLQSALRQMLQALTSAGHENLAVDIAVHGRCAGCAHLQAPAG